MWIEWGPRGMATAIEELKRQTKHARGDDGDDDEPQMSG